MQTYRIFLLALVLLLTPTDSATVRFDYGTNTSTFSPTTTLSPRTPSRSNSDSASYQTFSMTITTVTPPLTESRSVSVSQMTVSLSETLAETHTPTISDSQTVTATEPSETYTGTDRLTETPEFTDSATDTFSEQLTTTALPQTTSVPLSTTLTLRSSCPDCKNGYCGADTKWICMCYEDTIRGFWDGGKQGGTCSVCKQGYFGLTCTQTCRGGACDPCSGHGTCNDGITGDGTCTCVKDAAEGYWDGPACDRCAGNYYGYFCNKLCECNGHGFCSAGRLGRGACDCNVGYSGSDCSVCDPAIVPNCIQCLNLCSGHGRCGNAQSGTIGECQCNQFWAGEDCSIGCPLQCSNAGNCSDGLFGSGNCTCKLNHEPPACDRCTPEFWGAECNITCNCSGHGRCGRLDGYCQCDVGYVGSSCQVKCAQSATGEICGNHGKCTVDGGCACYRSSKTGYWTNESCTDCLLGYSGSECKSICPRSSSGILCGGNGVCDKNTTGCSCFPGRCGTSCEGTLLSSGECSPCAEADSFGLNCEQKCNCVNGQCDSGAWGTGFCTCSPGWHGPSCASECPGGASNPCSSHGECNQETGRCTCDPDYGTADCSMKCEDCGSHGTCDSGSGGTAQCVCDENWVFPETKCSNFCNCSGHGSCDRNLTCMCDSNWEGENCTVCVAGKAGPNCDKRCVYGTTSGTSCICDKDVGGDECELKCPSYDGLICGGVRGRCLEGYTQPGICFCFSPYVGPACQCDTGQCEGTTGLRVCNATNGKCECSDRREGEKCDECSRNYWGLDCTSNCQCSGNGKCERASGLCICDFSASTGFWAGDSCQVCADGFVGERCQQPSVTVAQLSSLQSRYVLGANQDQETTNNFIVLDNARQQIVGGGSFYQVGLFTNSTRQTTNATHVSATDKGDAFCPDHINSWIIDEEYYVFASSGESCNDAYRLFRSNELPANLQSSILSTSVKGIVGSTLYRDQGELILCYVPNEQGLELQLMCHIVTSATPQVVYTQQLVNMRNVAGVSFSDFLKSVIISGFGIDGCTVEFFQLLVESLTIRNPRTYNVYRDVPTCTQVDCIHEKNKLLIMGLSIPRGVHIRVLGLQSFRSQGTIVVLPSGQCTTAALDAESDIGVIMFQRLTVMTVVKFVSFIQRSGEADGGGNFNVPTLSVLGLKSIPNVEVADVVIDPKQRMAFGVARRSIGIVILRFFLADVLSVSPKYVDRRGGTLVTVTGRGFNDLNPRTISCKFGDTTTSAFYISNTTVHCVAPAVSTFLCDEQPVEVSLNGWGYTDQNIGVNRVEPPTLVAASPPRVRSSDRRNVTVTGQGFVPTGSLLCKYSDGITTKKTAAVYVSSQEIVCQESDNSGIVLFTNSTLDVSLDGGTFTEAPVAFNIIGPLHHVICEPNVVSNFSSERTTFNEKIVAIAQDIRNNSILELDTVKTRLVQVWFQRSATTSNVTFALSMVDGRSEFIHPEFAFPKVDDIVFHVRVDSVFTTTFILRVEQGELHQMNVTQQPSSEVFSGERLTRNPKVELLDIAGNRWIPDEVTLVVPSIEVDGQIRLNYAPETVSAAGDVEFFNLPIDSRFGIQLYLVFTIPSYPNVPLARSTLISANCAELEYRFEDPGTGELSCIRCPAGASCNGTDVLILRDGFWRQNVSIPIVYQCQRSENCIGGATVGVCSPGNTGPMCTLCVANYGKDQSGVCKKCDARGVVILNVILTVLATFVGIVCMCLICIQYYDDDDHPLVIPYILIDFGQAVAMLKFLDLDWPEFMSMMFSYIGMVSDLQLHTLASDCELRSQGKTYLDKAIFYYCSLLFVPLVALLVKLILKRFPHVMLKKSIVQMLTKSMQVVDTVTGKKVKKVAATALYKHTPNHHKVIPVLCVSLQVYLFLSYQTTCNHSLNIFECKTILRGPTPEKLLQEDLTVNCESQEYQQAYGGAVFVSVLYGLAFPVAATVGTAALVSRFRAEKAELRKIFLSFQLLGLRDGCWYWQTIVMIRKFACLVVAIWNPYPLDAFLTMWIFNIYTLMVWRIRPFEKEYHNFIEILAFYSIGATINLGLLHRVAPWSAMRISIIVVVFMLFSSLALVIIYYTLSKLRRAVQGFIATVLEMKVDRDMESENSSEAAVSEIDMDELDTGNYFDENVLRAVGDQEENGQSRANEEDQDATPAATTESSPQGLLQQPLLDRGKETEAGAFEEFEMKELQGGTAKNAAPTNPLPPFQ